jgi:hypothetical protein
MRRFEKREIELPQTSPRQFEDVSPPSIWFYQETNPMTNLRKFLSSIFAVALVALCLPLMAAAQDNNNPYDGNYGRDRDNRSSDRRDNDRYGNYDNRRLRESVKRLDNLSEDFRKHLKKALEEDRYDHNRREDRINDVAKDFRRATDDLKDRLDDGRNLYRSRDEARRVLQLGSRLDGFMRRNRLDGRVESDWARIRQELNVVAYAYGFNSSGFDHRYSRNDDRGYRDNDNRQGTRNQGDTWPW